MNTIVGRIAAGAALLAAPVLLALGASTISHADTASFWSVNASNSTTHPAFPNQHNFPQPGTAIHHHHQNNK
jgi:hypothetical protein